MTLDEVDEFATSLAGPDTVLVRVGFDDRERLLTAYPETFGVPPRWEAPLKVQADLDGDADGSCEAIRLAWAMQRDG